LTSPAVRVALGESFNSPEVNVEGKMVAAIKELGFDYVLDTTFGADLTIMEEANELIERIESGKNLPQFTSCCPAWVRYVEIYHPELIDNLSTAKSPISMQTAMIKSYFAEMMDIPREKIVTVAVAPCTSKKLEAKIHPETDYVITTQELSLMIKEKEINFNELQPAEFDPLMQRGSGGGVIFGSSGGVTESALRAVYYFLTKKEPPEHLLDFKEVRGYDNIKEAEVVIDNLKLHVLVAHGLTNIEKVISDLKEHKKQYDFIEVMNCPGGCVGGGGQPLGITSKQQESNEKRQQGLYEEDRNLKLRNCYANPEIIDIYRSYLGYPLSEKAELLLHTEYKDESGILGE
jgi:ferredoxin hydrogenase